MEADEYLEKIAAERYARVLDLEENVVRNLPFAAAALAITFAFMAAIRGDIPTKVNDIFTIVIWALLVLFWTSIAAAQGFLWAAITTGSRRLLILSSANDLRNYMQDLRRYYTALENLNDDQIEKQILSDMRTLMIEQYELGAVDIQRINEGRVQARDRAFLSLIVALIIALETVVFIFGHKVLYGGTNDTIVVQGRT